MAEGKKSFVLYSDITSTVKKLIEKDRINGTNNSGELFYHILMYVSDENPEPINDTVDLVFEPIKMQLKRDLTKWETRSERSRENGKKGGRPSTNNNPKKPEETHRVILEPEKPDSVIMCNNVLSDSVNVNDSVSANDILLKKETKKNILFDFRKKLIEYGFEKKLVDDWLSVRKTKKATNTETAFNAFISEIESVPCDINEMLKICVTQSWSGFKHKWVYNLKNQNNGTGNKGSNIPATDVELKQQSYDAVARLLGRTQ